MPRIALSLCAALCLVVIGTAALAPRESAARTAQPAAEPNPTVMLYDTTLTFRTLPQALVLAELEHPDGSRVAGVGIADASGVANVMFVPMGMDQAAAVIRPGDRITLAPFGERPVAVDVPALTADVDVGADRVVGTAPAGASVAVELSYGRPARTITATVQADAAGAFALDLAGQVDLPPDATAGSAMLDTAEGARFVARFQAFRGDVTIGARGMSGRATPGTRVHVAVRHAGGGASQAATEVTGAGAWSVRTGNPYDPSAEGAIRSGDVVSITTSGGPLGGDRTSALLVPEMAIRIDSARDLVSGSGPPDSRLTVHATSLDGDEAVTETTTGADGSFSADLSGAADLRPGWRVRAAMSPSPQVTVGRFDVLPQARVGVHTSRVRGLADPGSRITVTLRAAAGQPKHTAVAMANETGGYTALMGGFMPGAEAAIVPGDQVEVTYVAGDPLTAIVPDLSARADEAQNAVTGRAQPLAEVRALVRADPSAPVVTATADDEGRYVAAFGPGYRLQRPRDGSVIVGADGSLAFYTTWAAIQLNLQLAGDQVFLMANGAPGRGYEARLLDADGTVVGHAAGTAYDLTDVPEGALLIGSGGFFYLTFTDVTGSPVPVRAGDTIHIAAGDDHTTLQVPPLEATVFVEQNVVAGRAAPGSTVIIVVQSVAGRQAPAQVVADENGAFTHAYDDYDIQYNDTVQLLALVDGHIVARYVPAPGLVLDLDSGLVNGTLPLEPGTRLRLQVLRGTETLLDATTVAAAGGGFGMRLTDGAGRALELVEGDRLVVQPIAPPGQAVTMDIPELSVEADAAANQVWGRATPGGLLVVLLTTSQLRFDTFPIAQAWPEIAPDGTWTARPVPSHDVRPGSVALAQYRVAGGHVALRTRYVPLAGVEHGSPNVCGVAQPEHAVAARLHEAAGAELARASGSALLDGRYHLALAGPDGRLASSGAGHTVRAELAGTAVAVDVPEMDVSMDWTSGEIRGNGPPASRYYAYAPARRCLEVGDALASVSYVSLGETEPDGSLYTFMLPLEPGQGFELSFDTVDGHRVYKQVYRALGQIYIDRDRVTGLTNAGAAVAVELAAGGGAETVSTAARADADGRFDARFGSEVVIRAGDVVTVSAAGDSAAIQVEPLQFDWSPGEAVAGSAPAGRQVTLALRLASGRVLSVDLTADGDGAFRFGPMDVPPRAAWSWADVTAVRVVLATPHGHQVIAQTDGFEARPRLPATAIYLPFAKRSAGRAGAAAALTATDLRRSAMKATFETKELPALHVAALRHVGPYQEVGQVFGRLMAWAGPRGLLRFPETQTLAVYHDDPGTVEAAKLRSDACITVPEGTPVEGEVTTMTIPGGLFAVGHFELDESEYGAAWDKLMGEYVPQSGYAPDERLCYELYLNDPQQHPQGKHIVDICEPVRPR